MSADPFGEEDEEADADEKMRMDEENETDIDGGAMGTMVDDDDDDNNDDFDEEEEGEEEDLMENPERIAKSCRIWTNTKRRGWCKKTRRKNSTRRKN